MSNSILNPELLQLAKSQVYVKQGFVDPASAGAAAGGAMAGPMPPMPPMGADPAMAGGDPAMMGADPAAAGGGGDPMADIMPLIQTAVSQAMAAQGGGAAAGGAGGERPKAKVDVNQEIYQIKKLLVSIAENMGIPISPSMLLGDPAMDPSISPEEAAKDPLSAAANPENQQAISPIEPIQGAAPPAAKAASKMAMAIRHGQAVDVPQVSVSGNVNRARAILGVLNARAA